MKKPPRLVVTCIVALCLATLFVCYDLSQVGGQVWGAWVQSRPGMQQLATPPGLGPTADAGSAMMRETLALQGTMRPFLVALSSIDLLVGFVLIAGAAMTLSLSPTGRRLFAGALVAAMVWDAVGLLVNGFVQWRSQQLMRRFMSQAMTEMPAPAAGEPDIGSLMSTWMGATTAVSLACAGGWLALKVAFYVSSLVYLRRAEVVALFARTDAHGAARADGMPRG